MDNLQRAIEDVRKAVFKDLESFDPIGTRYISKGVVKTEEALYFNGHPFELVGYRNGVPQYRSSQILEIDDLEKLPF